LPVQKRANEALKKLNAGDINGAIDIIKKKLASEKAGKEIESEIQSHNSSHRHKKRKYEKLQEDIVKLNPRIGYKEFEKVLRTHIGKGIILSMDDSLNEIRLKNDDRIFKISGLKHRLTKIKRII